MKSLMIALPVTCRRCGVTSMSKFPILVVATALIKWHNMHLYARCHTGSWDASDGELSAFKAHLGLEWLAAHRRKFEAELATEPLLECATPALKPRSSKRFSRIGLGERAQWTASGFVDLQTWKAGAGYLH